MYSPTAVFWYRNLPQGKEVPLLSGAESKDYEVYYFCAVFTYQSDLKLKEYNGYCCLYHWI